MIYMDEWDFITLWKQCSRKGAFSEWALGNIFRYYEENGYTIQFDPCAIVGDFDEVPHDECEEYESEYMCDIVASNGTHNLYRLF